MKVPGEFETYTKQKLDEMLRLFYASIKKKDGEMMKKSSVNLLRYGLAKHLKETAQIDTALCVDLLSFDFINSEILSSVMSANAMTSAWRFVVVW
jgi:hypothetical protein